MKIALVRCGKMREHDLVVHVVDQLDAIFSGLENWDLVGIEWPGSSR